jgi:hypothetical protein
MSRMKKRINGIPESYSEKPKSQEAAGGIRLTKRGIDDRIKGRRSI